VVGPQPSTSPFLLEKERCFTPKEKEFSASQKIQPPVRWPISFWAEDLFLSGKKKGSKKADDSGSNPDGRKPFSFFNKRKKSVYGKERKRAACANAQPP